MGAIWVNAGYQKRETLRVELKSDLKRLPDPKLIDTVMALSNTVLAPGESSHSQPN